MPQKISAGLLMYRYSHTLQVCLGHPGGPYFKKKDQYAWTIPKGIVETNEPLLHAALREFHEETSIIPIPPFLPLGSVKYSKGKILHAWAFKGSWEVEDGFESNTFTLEWPPKTGNMQEFPELNELKWFTLPEAEEKIHPVQWGLIQELLNQLCST